MRALRDLTTGRGITRFRGEEARGREWFRAEGDPAGAHRARLAVIGLECTTPAGCLRARRRGRHDNASLDQIKPVSPAMGGLTKHAGVRGDRKKRSVVEGGVRIGGIARRSRGVHRVNVDGRRTRRVHRGIHRIWRGTDDAGNQPKGHQFDRRLKSSARTHGNAPALKAE